jgi:hypothetical protein
MLEGIVGTRDESIDDVVKFMLDYAESMRKRQKDAVEGDKMLPCSTIALRMEDTASRIKAALRRERAKSRSTLNLKNPPPKRVRLTKNLGRETRWFLNYLDLMLLHEAPRQLRDAIVENGLTDLRANWNTWWDQEKRNKKK